MIVSKLEGPIEVAKNRNFQEVKYTSTTEIYPLTEKRSSMKEEKIQLMHPAGKKLPQIDKSKYDKMRKAILDSLRKGPLTHKEMHHSVLEAFHKGKVKFEGAVEWYLEGVKLDLEAAKQIQRLNEKAPHQWSLVKK